MLSNLKKYIANKINKPNNSYEQMVQRWFHVNGDKTLRLDYDLDKDSIIFDLGGYEGQWTSDIFSKYCCPIYVFEPVDDYSNNIKHRFIKNEKISIYNFGLANENKIVKLSFNRDSSSMYKKGKFMKDIQLVKFEEFIVNHNVDHIDLIKINIEGAEYDLMEYLIKIPFINKIKNIQIQFHDFVPDAYSRMTNIQRELQKTHGLTYQYQFVWENWRLKDS